MRGRGLPIAAHLALLVALTFASAFVVMLAVLTWLPPRPPNLMRADHLVAAFARGYAQARETARAPTDSALHWRITAQPPRALDNPPARIVRAQVAQRLSVNPDAVMVAVTETARRDVVFYRVRDIEAHGRMREMHELHVRLHAPPPPPAANRAPPPPLFAPPPGGVILLAGFEIGARLPNGRWLIMRQGADRDTLGWFSRAALILGATLAVLSCLALVFAHRLAAPIQSFARAVQSVGLDPTSESVRPAGPRELHAAAQAVNAMQARLRALITDRTRTLATVAHDMRTPLMRLRLAAENVEPPLRERMAKEIGNIEALISSFIAFARDDPAEEARVRLDLAALLQSLVDDREAAGERVSYEGAERLVMSGQMLGLTRLFSNLIDNAVHSGAGARVSLRDSSAGAIIDIQDDGPGIPVAEHENVFKPFVRLNAEAGGAGLGLPAARAIARAHGGDVAIVDSPKGAHFQVVLPL